MSEPALEAGRCDRCGRVSFPVTQRCSYCPNPGAIERFPLSQSGRLFEWTTVHSPAPGFTAPYRVGYVDLPEGIRLFGQIDGPIDEDLSVGETVQVVVADGQATDKAAVEDGSTLPYAFVRAGGDGESPLAAVTAAAAATNGAVCEPELPSNDPESELAKAAALGEPAFVAGVGMTQFGRHINRSADSLAQEAIVDAIDDANIAASDIEVVYVGHVFQGRVAGQRILRDIGLSGRPTINVENACASGASAFHLAVQAVGSGRVDVALAVGVEQLSMFGRGVIPPDRLDLEGAHGRTNPATYAIMAKRHMAEYGSTTAEMAAVVVQARANGHLNVRAQLRALTTVDEVLGSPMIAEPLTRLHCCPTGDGAAAAIVVSERVARRIDARQLVRVEASVVRGGLPRVVGDPFVNHPVTSAAVSEAYAQAGLGPQDIDVVELHDAFAIAALVHLEDLGFLPPGEAGQAFVRGDTAVTGRLPVNPSGGLLAKGHPLGASGLAQIFELVMQLRGASGDRQVEGARTALAQCEGGVVYGLDAGVCAIHILAA